MKERRMRILEGRFIVGVIGNCILPRIKLQDGERERPTASARAQRGIERDDTRFPALTIIYKHVTSRPCARASVSVLFHPPPMYQLDVRSENLAITTALVNFHDPVTRESRTHIHT